MKHYTEKINDPVDGFTYKMLFTLPEKAKIIIKQIGGSLEKCTFKCVDGLLEITTPTWVKNPEAILIGYELQ